MIVLVWSLVSSVVELARKRRLTAFLNVFLADHHGRSLVCRRRNEVTEPASAGRLTRFTSEPELSRQEILFRNDNTEILTDVQEPLRPSEWRFVEALHPNDERMVFFVAAPAFDSDPPDELPQFAIFLESTCARVAWSRVRVASVYGCPIERFVDIVYAFSESALYENNTKARIEYLYSIPTPNTLSQSDRPNSSLSGSHPSFAPKPLPLLEQLFWGDPQALASRKPQYHSDLLINGGRYGSLPRRFRSSPRRRYRSDNYGEDLSKISISIDLRTNELLDFAQQIPPYIRYLEDRRNSLNRSEASGMESLLGDSSIGISPSITIDDLETTPTASSQRSDGTVDLPYVDDSDVTLSPVREVTSYAALISKKHQRNQKQSNGELKISEDSDPRPKSTQTLNSRSNSPVLLQNVTETSVVVFKQSVTTTSKPPLPVIHASNNNNNNDNNNKNVNNNRSSSSRTHTKQIERHNNETVHGMLPQVSRRRHSAMVGNVGEPVFDIFDRNSLRRPYTPSRKFHRSSEKSQKAMYKPPSILVYTGGEADLYTRIRKGLTRIIPVDRYTVFNISVAALKKQPWIEPTTACLVIADTKDLDDSAWLKMQTYFNQSGKIIFVCQNRLLASLTNCESSKKQADIIRMAFGNRGSVAMGKDFESFLKKSLKSLTKNGQVNETFHSKDLNAGMSYSVVLSKNNDSPLLLYMENSAHQASAVFSDATSEQLLATGSRILADSLSRVGVAVEEVALQELTPALLTAKDENKLSALPGVRYGEAIGTTPKLFIRVADKVRQEGLPPADENLLPVQMGIGPSGRIAYRSFDFARYFARLKTQRLGHVALHVPIATTTMDIATSLNDAIPTCEGTVVIAGQQVNGQGRGGNEFVSPLGAAMFTVSLTLNKTAKLAKNPSFIQHVFAVAVVEAVRTLSGIEEFPLCIKWPNDFYFKRSHKVGGMLATAKSRDDGIMVNLGCGLNVCNSQPTICLNDMLPEGSEARFTVEEVIAETLNSLEKWLSSYEVKIDGDELFRKEYYEYWLHSREEVLLEELNERVVIRGLDKYGYLQVRSKKDPAKLWSVGDNGNTFDMMKGLIRHKIA